jgi:hypothetical protein
MDPHARALVTGMCEAGKPTCAICHGQWVMVSAKILKGKRATAVWNIQIDLENAGTRRCLPSVGPGCAARPRPRRTRGSSCPMAQFCVASGSSRSFIPRSRWRRPDGEKADDT